MNEPQQSSDPGPAVWAPQTSALQESNPQCETLVYTKEPNSLKKNFFAWFFVKRAWNFIFIHIPFPFSFSFPSPRKGKHHPFLPQPSSPFPFSFFLFSFFLSLSLALALALRFFLEPPGPGPGGDLNSPQDRNPLTQVLQLEPSSPCRGSMDTAYLKAICSLEV